MHSTDLFHTAAEFVNNTSRHIFLTGKAGTGKTTFLKYIRENTRKKCVVVAPTGVAAINAGGVTMHSFFQLPLGPFLPVAHKRMDEGVTDAYTLFKNIRVSEEKRAIFRDLELLIIDEVSMVRADMLDATDAILRYFRKTPHTPFGGVQVLFIGDLFQLPPVMPDSQWSLLREYYESPFFFHSKVVEQARPVYIELKKIYRQSQQNFIDILNRIRNNEVTSEDLETLNRRSEEHPKPGVNYITLTTHNAKADRINADALVSLAGSVHQFKGAVEGDFPEKILPTDPVLQIKEGAQVMFIRNDKNEERRFYNGKLATVKRIDEKGIYVVLADTDQELLLEQETWYNIRYSYNQQEESINEEKLGSFTQFPIRLAWAITIHKSQGLTFQNAIIDAGESFASGQVYVALSRCTSLDGLIIRSRIGPSSISTDRLVLEFSRRESGENELAELLEREKKEFEFLQLAKTFDLQKFVDALGDYTRLVQGTDLPDDESARTSARRMREHVAELQNTASKFQLQIKGLLDPALQDKLRERVVKAIEYFSTSLKSHLLDTLEDHLTSLKGVKKKKKYLQYVRDLRNAIAGKINSIQHATYGEVKFNPDAKDIEMRTSGIERAEKGNSLRETLALLKSGMKPDAIAEKRNLALGTIETHLGQLIKKGELDIYDCFARDKVESIVAVVREVGGASLRSVKDRLGDGFSYGEIRAVMSHLQLREK